MLDAGLTEKNHRFSMAMIHSLHDLHQYIWMVLNTEHLSDRPGKLCIPKTTKHNGER